MLKKSRRTAKIQEKKHLHRSNTVNSARLLLRRQLCYGQMLIIALTDIRRDATT